jgi:PHD/YefM family antitoxin component YafN of YafNO toxin-antitoxin module
MEGLENNTQNGVANSAAAYAESITKQMNVLQDSLLISKYKTDYENVIINLEDYISTLMMDTSLKLSLKDGASPENMTLLSNLNTLNNARQSLNTVMTFVDKH